MTFEQLIDRLLAQFDVAQATAVMIANERQRDMVVRARWLKAKKQVATTVAGTGTYALPSGVVAVGDVQVGTAFYDAAGLEDFERRTSGTWFTQTGDASGVALLALYPTPDATGTSIMATAILAPTDATYASATALVVPQDVHRHLHAGCRAELYQESEDNPTLAGEQEQVYEQGIVKLRGLSRRIRQGVTRVQIYGTDFSYQ